MDAREQEVGSYLLNAAILFIHEIHSPYWASETCSAFRRGSEPV